MNYDERFMVNRDPRIPVDPPIEQPRIALPECRWSGGWDDSHIHKAFREAVLAGQNSVVLKTSRAYHNQKEDPGVPLEDMWANSFLVESVEEDGVRFAHQKVTWVADAVKLQAAYPTQSMEGTRSAVHFLIRSLLHFNPELPASWGFYCRWLLKIDFTLEASYESLSWGQTEKWATLAWRDNRTDVVMVENIYERIPVNFNV